MFDRIKEYREKIIKRYPHFKPEGVAIPHITPYDMVEELIRETFGDNPVKMIEVGVYQAEMEKRLLKAFPNIHITGIDNIERPEATNMQSDRFKYIVKNSVDAAPELNDMYDFIFIDASHVSPDIDNDIELYLPKVRKGGIFAGHDYTDTAWDVKKVVDKVLGNEVNLGIELVWWIYV